LNKDYKIRSYQPADDKGIVELLKLVFDDWPHFDLNCDPLDHWRWKHKDNPLARNLISLGIVGDKIISCLHSIPIILKIGENVFLSWERVDGAVHPDFRRGGLFNKMSELTYETMIKNEVRTQYGITSNPILMKKYQKQGNPHLPHVLVDFIRIHDIDLHLKMVPTKNKEQARKIGFLFVKLVNRIRNTSNDKINTYRDFNISEINSFDDRINTFWDEIKDHYNFIVKRTRDYLNWRFCDHRGGEYKIKMVEVDGRILGYSVLRINKYMKDYPVGYIVDLIALPKCLNVINWLVADAVKYFDTHNINVIHCQLFKTHPYEAIIKRYGFVDSRYRLFMHFIPGAGIYKELNKIQTSTVDKLHFVYGDFDII
jgi:hypothetical protein